MSKPNKKIYLFGLPLFIVLGVFLLTKNSYAGVLDLVMNPIDSTVMVVVGTIVQTIVFVMGMIISIVIWAVIHIASYNNFINETPIINAWIIVRDFCNMLFILVLLVIAFATILRVESYNAKKLLPKLLMMAILINFSRTICGLIIDGSQIVMLTFVNAIGQGGGNFVNTLGVQDYLNMAAKETWKGEINLTSTVGGLILGVVFLVIAATVMCAFLAVLVVRIVMLWIYVVLSPLAFILSTFPSGQKYSSEWWSDFVNYAVSGPILAFFLWLALVSSNQITSIGGDGSGAEQCFGPAQILCTGKFINFVVAIGMLVGGLMITQKLGGTISKAASFGENWSKKGLKLGGAATLGTMAWGARKIKTSDGKLGGLELNPVNIYKGIKEGFEQKKRKEIAEGEAKSADALRQGGGAGLIKGLGASKDMTEAMAKGWFAKEGIKMAYQTFRAPERRKKLGEKEQQLEDLNTDMDSKSYASELSTIRELNKLEEKKKAGNATDEEKKRISNLKVDLNSKLGGMGEVTRISREVKKGDEDIAKKTKEIIDFKENSPIRTPYTFEANMGRKKSVREAMSKIGDNDNSDDLVDMWRHAKAVNDKELAAAVFLAAAKKYGLLPGITGLMALTIMNANCLYC
ncbi:MAG: hypothetical protein UT64_C0020G0002 [Candidatus Falkowbacteria bacterium GW2011_GWF2_39_8]|uniref:TrbL/VirB6 plasmid conjugal transfer protein n=1 Tax=Candidatus Falkowbacteria bacterium GW2011_GWF2_39_8 TaxID=1618642 RepID=A0A0G0T4U7_9BACT|nr:MAG: hypothetical protein UT64_C0020G0002 [Candidatus Falkowbacteria bacterium GW2011_GWF2_39_8]